MHYALAFAGLTVIVAAAPMQNMAADINYKKYQSYTPYTNYSPYPKAVDEAAANMGISEYDGQQVPDGTNNIEAESMKRDNMGMGMAADVNYKKYSSYTPYIDYRPYPAAVEEAAVKLGMGEQFWSPSYRQLLMLVKRTT
jgi:hypothetical protein